jgi:hypothetical protein
VRGEQEVRGDQEARGEREVRGSGVRGERCEGGAVRGGRGK